MALDEQCAVVGILEEYDRGPAQPDLSELDSELVTTEKLDGGPLTFTRDAVQTAQPWDRPARAVVANATGRGYLVMSNTGVVYNFGDAPTYGSLEGTPLRAVGLAPAIQS